MEIKKGNRFVCIEDVSMYGGDDEIAYIKGNVYTSEKDRCITDEFGDKDHIWCDDSEENFFIPYSKLDRVYTKATDRLKDLHGDCPYNIDYFDNCNSYFDTGHFEWAKTSDDYYTENNFTYLSEQAFIEFMGLVETTDAVNKPSHYNNGSIEPIDYITANSMNFLEGNVVKYVTRYKFKNGLEDLKKAEFYLKRLIEEYKS